MIKAIALDLDDTLLDTTGLLAPQYALETFQFMISKGLKLSLVECEFRRRELIKKMSHREVFEGFANEFGTDETRAALERTIEMFYNPALPEKLPLMEGARENIDYLKTKYSLYLVTAGAEKSQLAKAEAMGVMKDFKKVIVVNSLLKHRKKDAFQNIVSEEKIESENLLCVGNSITSEIKDALAIGAITCHFEHGEARGEISDLIRPPHFHIKHHSELIQACRL
ncbi:MAG: HAD family hydrolase [Pseudobdellovibrio sp.]